MLHITSAQYRDIIPLLTTAAVSLSSDKNHKNLNILISLAIWDLTPSKKQKESFLNVMCIQNLLTITWWVGRTLSEKCSRGLYF